MRTTVLCLLFSISAFTVTAQITGTSWSLYGPDETYYFDFIFDENDTLYADVGGLGILQPLATYMIEGNTITVLQSDPEDDCTTPGIYSYEIVGDSLLFTLVSDACADRVFIFTEFSWISAISTAINEDPDPIGFTIHPNPSTGMIRIYQKATTEMQLRIFDLAGELVHESTLTSMNTVLDLAALPKAMYVLQASSGDRRLTQRIILQ